MARTRKSKTSRPSAQTNWPRSTWKIVLVNEQPIRELESRKCRRLMQAAEREREKLRLFNENDIPGYERWSASHFGSIQTELRELDAAENEKLQLLEEIELEMLWTHCSPSTAYRRVTQRRQQEEEFTQNGDEQHHRSHETATDEFEEHVGNHDAFDHFLEDVAGIDPAHLSDEDYEEMYERYLKEMRDLFGLGPDPEKQQHHEIPRKSSSSRTDSTDSTESKCKQLFRALVRKLHPDTRADDNATVGRLWHAVQDAWNARDLDRLQLLASFTDIAHGSFLSATISELQRIAGELETDVQNLRRELRRTRKRPEWGFSKLKPEARQSLEQKIRTKLEHDLAEARKRHDALAAKLASWATPGPQSPPKKQPPRKTPQHTDHPEFNW